VNVGLHLPLIELCGDTLATVGKLQALCEDEDTAVALTSLGARDLDQPELGELLLRQVADLSFAACLELQQVQRALEDCPPDRDEILQRCDGSSRRLLRGLSEILRVANQLTGKYATDILDEESRAAEAVAVRTMYEKFRRSLPPCDPEKEASVRRSLSFAAVSLAGMIAGANFTDVRLGDRVMFQKLQKRVLDWLHNRDATESGAHIYEDIVTSANLLRSINMRQELKEHDRNLVIAAVKSLNAGSSDPHAVRTLLAELEVLRGRDNELTSLLDQIPGNATDPDYIMSLRAALSRLVKELS